MAQIAYHASQEQFAPPALLRYALLAEKVGFDAIHLIAPEESWHKSWWMRCQQRLPPPPEHCICGRRLYWYLRQKYENAQIDNT